MACKKPCSVSETCTPLCTERKNNTATNNIKFESIISKLEIAFNEGDEFAFENTVNELRNLPLNETPKIKRFRPSYDTKKMVWDPYGMWIRFVKPSEK